MQGRKVEVIGKRYGRLIIEDEYKRHINGRSILFLKVKCDCGNTKEVRKEKVLRGDTKSCGCLQKASRKNLGAKRKLPYGEASFNECYVAYKASAKRRGYRFDLTKEQFREIITQPCIYCGESLTQRRKAPIQGNGDFEYTGIDRYDNSKGYVLENCVPCCKKCNRIKTDMSVEEMETSISKILSRKDIWMNLRGQHK